MLGLVRQKALPMARAVNNVTGLQSNLGAAAFEVQRRNYWGNRNEHRGRFKMRPNKHWNQDYKNARARKVLHLPNKPDFDFQRKLMADEITPDERRAFMKKNGLTTAANQREEEPVLITSTGAIFEEFLPKESESGMSQMSTKEGLKERTLGKGKTFRASRKIKKYDEDFDPKSFATETAVDVYTKAHMALSERRHKELHEHVTEFAYPNMVHNVESKTIFWQYIKALEPPTVVQIRNAEILAQENLFSQITVRMHTQQILAVYDRFGRLIHGHPSVAKDVLEYVIFEKHLASLYGKWRLHAKIVPEWLSAYRSPSYLTQVVSNLEDLSEDSSNEKESRTQSSDDDEDTNEVLDQYGRKMSK